MPSESTATNAVLLGLTQLSIVNNTAMTFSFNYDTSDVLFPSNSPINSLRYVILSQIQCPPSYFPLWVSNNCGNDRGTCGVYYQFFSNIVLDSLKTVKIHSSMKIFAVSSNYEVKLYRYNGALYSFFTSFYIPIQTSHIKKM